MQIRTTKYGLHDVKCALSLYYKVNAFERVWNVEKSLKRHDIFRINTRRMTVRWCSRIISATEQRKIMYSSTAHVISKKYSFSWNCHDDRAIQTGKIIVMVYPYINTIWSNQNWRPSKEWKAFIWHVPSAIFRPPSVCSTQFSLEKCPPAKTWVTGFHKKWKISYQQLFFHSFEPKDSKISKISNILSV